MKQFSAQTIIEIHDFLIKETGGEPGIIYEGSIYFIPDKAALKRSIEGAAAVYLFEIIKGHPFIDGNKRTGTMVSRVFLDRNGYYLDVGDEEARDTALKIARGEMGYKETENWIKEHLRIKA
jgi:death-on-curing protein